MVMKQTIAISVMMATMILFGLSVAYAGCNNLTVTVNSDGWNVDTNSTSCAHGHIEYSGDKLVIMTNTGYYGPDCRIGFLNPTKGQQSIVEFQQDYCCMEAGDITVTLKSGQKPNTVITEGSFKDGKGGKVTINGFK
jgi:hypothetical protein